MQTKPNILLITTDQQRFDTINALGNGSIFTPHLNWLADEGIAFERCYADCPVCMPSRATLMTGRHGYTNQLTQNNHDVRPLEKAPTLPGLLSQHGYQTRAQGKMHFEPMRAHYGFESMELPMDYFRERKRLHLKGGSKAHGLGENEIEPCISTSDETESLTHWTVQRSIDFIETRDPTRPFFLWTSFTKPHPPWDPSQKYWQLYDQMDLGTPAAGDWMTHTSTLETLRVPSKSLNNAEYLSPQQQHASRRAYYATITETDYQLGLLFARMRELGLFENTWIIFTSDHGEMLGDHSLYGKSLFLEGSAHVPLLIRPPNSFTKWDFTSQARTDRLVCLADLMPTILKQAGCGSPEGMDGQDIFAGDPDPDRTLIGECGNYFALIGKQFKYLWCRIDGSELLFDLSADPREEHDLITVGSHKEVHTQMRNDLIQTLSQRNHECVVDGNLQSNPPATAGGRRSKWAGFHSTSFPTDVLH